MTRLIFQPLPSKYLYVNTPFPLEITVVDELGRLVHECIEFHLDLNTFSPRPSSSQQMNCNEYFEIIRPTGRTGDKITTSSDGKCFIEIKLFKLSSEVIPFTYFHFVATPTVSLLCCCGISEPFSCIQYRLVISNLHQLPSVWYKDQSYSKNHVIHIQVQLQSSTGVVKGLVVPIKVQLRYCGKDGAIEILPTPDQKILKISSPKNSLLVINQKGTCHLECNFTQVSSRHYHRNFAFCIQADESYANANTIGPVEFGNIEVRSKIWKGKKKEIDRLIEDIPSAIAPTTDSALISNPFPYTRGSLKRSLDERTTESGQIDDCEISSPLTQHLEKTHDKSHLFPQSPTFKSPLLDFQPEHSFFSDIFDVSHRKSSHRPELIEWIHQIMSQIKDLKWREIGRESIPCQSSDGDQLPSLCQSVPLYDMPFPNQIIDQILESYLSFFPDPLISSDSSHSHSSSQPVTDAQLTSSETTSRSGTDSNMSTTGSGLRDNERTQLYHHSPRQGRTLHPPVTYRDPFLPLSSSTFSPQRLLRGSRSNSLGSQGGQRSSNPLFAISEDTKGENN